MRPIICAIFSVILICGAFWAGGFDFKTRGEAAFCCYFISVAVGLCVYGYNKDMERFR